MSDLLNYKCPACGGTMEFDSSIQKMKCPYCDTVFEMADMEYKDEVLNKPEQDTNDNATDNMCVFICQSCGGEIIGDETTAATECPYCGNAVVMSGRFSGELKPDYIIPFKLDKKAAKAQYEKHISGKFLLPKTFRDQNHIDEIKGIYVPFWTFDSDIDSGANFVGKNIREWSDKNYNYVETAYYDVYRSGTMSFSNVPVDGSEKMDDDLMESIEPFDFSEAVPFQSAYLAGYFADRYDVDKDTCALRANERISQSSSELLRRTAEKDYSIVDEVNDNEILDSILGGNSEHKRYVNIQNGVVKYTLFPVWMLTTKYQNQKFTFAMNGQTGKFVGDLPVDKQKKRALFWSVFAGVSAVATAVAYFLIG